MHFTNHLALPQHTAEQDFWRGYFDAAIESITPQDLTARLEVSIDYDSHYAFMPSDLQQWDGRMLIVEADGDQFVPASERTALRALYPEAETYTFEQDGHSGTLIHAREYVALYRDFLARASS